MAEETPQERSNAEGAAPERVDAAALVVTCISLLASRAWEAMGLVADPVTKKVERRLEEAQLAIDAAGALVDLIKGRLPDAERRDLETLLANLRLNYVEQKARG